MTELTNTPPTTEPSTGDPDSWGPKRQRTVTWHDPVASAMAGMALPGLDYLRAIRDGQLPGAPIAGLIQMGLSEVEEGRVVFTCRPDESAYNPIGTVHGGLVCTLLDSVCGCALHTLLPQGRGYTSIDLNVSYLKAVTARSGTLTATGTVIKAGARVGFTQGTVTEESGALVATATSSLLIFDLPT